MKFKIFRPLGVLLRVLIHPLGRARAFAAGERGALSIEAAIMLPVMCLMYVGGYQYFDSYRREGQIYKASYAIADLLSRETAAVTPDYLDGLAGVFGVLTNTTEDGAVRFSELMRDEGGLKITWSHGTGDRPDLSDAMLQGRLSQVPRLAVGERVLLVETFTEDRPIFNVGLSDRIIDNAVPISPRYGACVPFSDADRGNNLGGCESGGGPGAAGAFAPVVDGAAPATGCSGLGVSAAANTGLGVNAGVSVCLGGLL